MEATPEVRYDSLAAMRAAYEELTERVGADILTPVNVEQVRGFILRGAATGSVLDAPKDRSTAQGLWIVSAAVWSPMPGSCPRGCATSSQWFPFVYQ